ncbi:MAG: hypothetical protein KF894_34550 [Labilithrix sp.]|nr:hypothetical protein [Labilithrix sp.]
METIRTPTFIIEGSDSPNTGDVEQLASAAAGAPVRSYTIPGENHFSTLAPITELLARKIVADDIDLTDADLRAAFARSLP